MDKNSFTPLNGTDGNRAQPNPVFGHGRESKSTLP